MSGKLHFGQRPLPRHGRKKSTGRADGKSEIVDNRSVKPNNSFVRDVCCGGSGNESALRAVCGKSAGNGRIGRDKRNGPGRCGAVRAGPCGNRSDGVCRPIFLVTRTSALPGGGLCEEPEERRHGGERKEHRVQDPEGGPDRHVELRFARGIEREPQCVEEHVEDASFEKEKVRVGDRDRKEHREGQSRIERVPFLERHAACEHAFCDERRECGESRDGGKSVFQKSGGFEVGREASEARSPENECGKKEKDRVEATHGRGSERGMNEKCGRRKKGYEGDAFPEKPPGVVDRHDYRASRRGEAFRTSAGCYDVFPRPEKRINAEKQAET